MDRKVALAITGSIAAYKGAALASALVAEGYEVRVILSRGGERFVSRLTFEALTGNPVVQDVWDEEPPGSRMGHLEIARWAEVLVVAPASAGAIARLAIGSTDDMLGAVALAARCPLLIAPAMETNMWQHPATQEHVGTLRARGATLIGPESGRLASGSTGEGRMSDPAVLVTKITEVLNRTTDLHDRTVLVTAGPTYEPIDPVRFIGNRSSGKMGYAIAEEARDRGAHVVLVAGPNSLPDPAGVDVRRVETQAEMRAEVLSLVRQADVIVMAAAVADFRPAEPSRSKVKRTGDLTLHLVPTSDVAAEASQTNSAALHVGFALESEDLLDHAREKMRRKNLDVIVANAISPHHSPFSSDTNAVTIITDRDTVPLPEGPKRHIAALLWNELVPLLNEKNPPAQHSR